ncbi:MAG: HIT domain-containing protein [Pseudomonadota bacterium]
MSDFELDPAFPATSHALGDLFLCHARLQCDARWPWIILIPRRPGARELEDLTDADRVRLMDEVVAAGAAARALGEATGRPVEKLNVGALGNITPQLHVHVVGRREGDAGWPGPVWGFGLKEPYRPEDLEPVLAAARRGLGL